MKHISIPIILSIISVIVLFLFLIPAENDNNLKIIDNYSNQSLQLDSLNKSFTLSNQFKDFKVVNDLKKQMMDLEFKEKIINYIYIFINSLLLLSIIGIISNYLQFIYTKFDFIQEDGANRVLSYSLLCTTLVILLVYYLQMSQ
jgi:small-conductance mechanosensitive channel